MLNHIENLTKKLIWLLLALMASGAWATDLIKIEGSSTVYPITHRLAQQFMRSEGVGTHVAVGITGTGGGFRKFCRGRTDVSNASRPIKEGEKRLCKANGVEYLELPVALDAVTVVINRNNDWVESLSFEELNRIWHVESKESAKMWNQLNEHYPASPITLYGPGSDSGTYDFFVNVVLNNGDIRRDYVANEDDTVIAAEIAADKNAMAFLGLAYYLENRETIKAVAVSKDGRPPTLPSVENVTNGKYGVLSRPLFIYVNKASLDKRESVKRFLKLYFDSSYVSQAVTQSGYIPLSPKMYGVARSRLQRGKVGSVFSSHNMSANFEQFIEQK